MSKNFLLCVVYSIGLIIDSTVYLSWIIVDRIFLRRPGTGVFCNALIINGVQKDGVASLSLEQGSSNTVFLYMFDNL